MKTHDSIAGLDGVRAIAIIAVIAFHANIPHLAPGGFLGVDVFFTLSGFLISSLLLRELRTSGSIALYAFYGRRLRRLMPAMLAVIAASSVAALLWTPESLSRQRQDIPAALLYISNWWQIYSGQSYFEMFGRPPLLQHLWSLAIEEQFYVAWPLALLGVGRLAGRRGVLALALALALLSVGAMAFVAFAHDVPSQASPNRLYLGTDTHAMGLLIGACLACLWRPLESQARPPEQDGSARAHPWGLEFAGLAGLAGLIGAFTLASESSAWLYRGGFAVVALLACLVMLGASQPRTLLGSVLSLRAVCWIGQRSYGLYLWHWPVFVLLRPGVELPSDAWLALGLRLLLTLALAELSFRWIEHPVRRFPVSSWQLRGWVSLAGACGVGALVMAQLYHTGPGAAGLLGASVRSVWALGPTGAGAVETGAAVAVARPEATAAAGAGTGLIRPEAVAASTGVSGMSEIRAARPEAASAFASVASAAASVAGPVGPLALPWTSGRFVLTAIGDSVMLGSQGQLARTLWPILVDAQSGRQGREGVKRARELRHASALADTVLVHLGTNGYLHESHLHDLLEELSDRKRVIFMTVHASRHWVDENNALLARVVAQYANASLINWQGVAAEHPEYLTADGVHLNVRGMQAYAGLIGQAVGYRPEAGTAPFAESPHSVLSVDPAQNPKDRSAISASSTAGVAGGQHLRVAPLDLAPQAPLPPPVPAPARNAPDSTSAPSAIRLESDSPTPHTATAFKLKLFSSQGSGG